MNNKLCNLSVKVDKFSQFIRCNFCRLAIFSIRSGKKPLNFHFQANKMFFLAFRSYLCTFYINMRTWMFSDCTFISIYVGTTKLFVRFTSVTPKMYSKLCNSMSQRYGVLFASSEFSFSKENSLSLFFFGEWRATSKYFSPLWLSCDYQYYKILYVWCIHWRKYQLTKAAEENLRGQKVLLTEKLTHFRTKVVLARFFLAMWHLPCTNCRCCVKSLCPFGIYAGFFSRLVRRVQQSTMCLCMCWFHITHLTSDIKLHK